MLLLHNRYQQPGGEDQVYAAEGDLLETHGHEVVRYTVHNDQAEEMSRPALARSTVWNKAVYAELRGLIRRERPEIAHFHNTFPLISPAAYYAARAEGVPMVQTLHNYRLFCLNALFFRDGRVCEDCLGKALPWPGVVHSCYRQNRAASGVVAGMLSIHRALNTWKKTVHSYVALTAFAREKFVEGGLPAEKVVVKPNFVFPDTGPGKGRGDFCLFVGRLSKEKGIDTLLAAWERLKGRARLKIVGDGPMAPEVAHAAGNLDGVEWMGRQPKEVVQNLMKDARCLVFPSVWYEGFPMVIVEAAAAGLPVVASDLGSMTSLVEHGRTGLRFRPGDPAELARRVEWSSSHPAEMDRMRGRTRSEFEAEYSAEKNYRTLREIYQRATDSG